MSVIFKRFLIALCCILIVCLTFSFSSITCFASETETYTTGLPELTDEDIDWQNKHHKKVKKVKLNKLGLERVNQWRKGKGLDELTDVDVSNIGQDLDLVTGADAPVVETSDLDPGSVPGSVDNSELDYFPPIRSQGGLNSCGTFSGTYYAMTYMLAMANGLDAKNGGDAWRLSPKWCYNMVNGGSNAGSWYYWSYEIGQKNGVASWQEFPYDNNYREWNTEAQVWTNSVYRRFDQYGYVNNTNTDTGIDQVKQMLLNGYILNFPTYINSWNWTTIKDDPSTASDDVYVGSRCAFWVNGTQGYHAMTVVGYDDSIWVDINGNNVVDTGEKGAFRIANSWGTGWGESGFCWMAYDALKSTSAVAGGPSTGRVLGWSPARAHWVTAKTGYTPTLIAEFTLSHLKRDQLRITLGTSNPGGASPTSIWIPEMLYNQGGAFGFDGTATQTEGTFVMDFTDLVPSGSQQLRFFLGIQDDTSGDPASFFSYALIDVASGIRIESSTPMTTADYEQIYATIDYDFYDGNISPTAQMRVSALEGIAPSTITFDAQDSYDSDGSIVSWQWDFGDNGSSSGQIVDHTYSDAGTYTAVLTVTDDNGATGTDSLVIEILPDPDNIMFIQEMTALLTEGASGTTVNVSIQVVDQSDNPVQGAQVAGSWSGLVSGDASGTTDSGGTVTLVSRKTKKTGNIAFTVTDITASGRTYDPGQNVISSVDVSTEPEPVNETPQAVISATPISGVAPLTVSLNGGDSYDPDGSISAFYWDLGDGASSESISLTHLFTEEGTYEIALFVTDDQGDVGTAYVTVEVYSATGKTLHLDAVDLSITTAGVNTSVTGEVLIVDSLGSPVANATVTGAWSGLVNGSASGVTGSDGRVFFTSSKTKSSGTVTFTVENVSASGYLYQQDQNSETEKTIAF